MKLVELHREFIDRTKRPMISNDLPIRVSNLDKPIIAIEKWKVEDGKLSKKYMFESYDDRNRFLKSIIEYETQIGHHSVLEINDLSIKMCLITKDVNKITEIDKEFAKYADIIRRDLVYKPHNEWFKNNDESGIE